MSEFIYHTHYRPQFKKCKPYGLSKCIEDEKSRIDGKLFDKGQLLDIDNNIFVEEEGVEDMALDKIDMAR